MLIMPLQQLNTIKTIKRALTSNHMDAWKGSVITADAEETTNAKHGEKTLENRLKRGGCDAGSESALACLFLIFFSSPALGNLFNFSDRNVTYKMHFNNHIAAA